MTITSNSTKRPRGRRKPPSLNSVLDQGALQSALDKAGLHIQPKHIQAFYQLLHRQHYPPLPQFVENYRHYDTNIGNTHNKYSDDDLPLKNSVTNKKNRNLMQLPKRLLNFLANTQELVTLTSKVACEQTSADKSTTKLAIELHDGQRVESVIMRYRNVDGSRVSLCVSSQCGCAMGCTFCATGTMGLSGNLTSGEILEQIVHADHLLAAEWMTTYGEKENNGVALERNQRKPYGKTMPKLDLCRNVVFMGMGEPLDNYRNVVDAAKALLDTRRWNLAHGRVTISTVGLVSQIRKLTAELPHVSLALSLHAPNQAMREQIVPTANRYPIADLIDALDNHMQTYLNMKFNGREYTAADRIKESTRRRAMIEYVMLEGPTSTFESAHELGALCKDRALVVNLIPYNATDVQDELKCPSEEHMQEFRRIVASYNTFCTVRRTMGADIDSACGQLLIKEGANAGNNNKTIVDIEDVVKSDTKPKKTVRLNLKRHTRTSDDKRKLEKWIQPLAFATAAAFSCFLVSAVHYIRQRRR